MLSTLMASSVRSKQRSGLLAGLFMLIIVTLFIHHRIGIVITSHLSNIALLNKHGIFSTNTKSPLQFDSTIPAEVDSETPVEPDIEVSVEFGPEALAETDLETSVEFDPKEAVKDGSDTTVNTDAGKAVDTNSEEIGGTDASDTAESYEETPADSNVPRNGTVYPGFFVDKRCANSLSKQVELLKSEYGNLLKGVSYVSMIGFPDHINKGDSAIYAGELVLLEALDIQVGYVCGPLGHGLEYNATRMREDLVAHGGPATTAIMFHGGGNFGDIWDKDQSLREIVVADFPDYPIRSFPQTYKFKNPKRLAIAQRIYGKHLDLQLTVRDTVSYSQLQIDFGAKHQILLAPDLATMLFTVPVGPILTRPYDFLVQFRNDGEGGQYHASKSGTYNDLQTLMSSNGTEAMTSILRGDWQDCEPTGISGLPFAEKARRRVEAGRQWLGSADLVLSDRLHVHILSTIWGIDHIAIEEGWYRKLMTYQETWLSECNSRVRFTNSVKDSMNVAKTWYKAGGSFDSIA